MPLLALILGILPGFAWLFFYLQEDLHPEPKKLIALSFVMGMAFAFFALGGEILFGSFMQSLGAGRLAIASLLGFALIEEGLKFAAAYLSIRNNPALDEPVDAMIYLVVAALGFATVENLGAVVSLSASQGAILSSVFATSSVRFVGATLLHSLTSGLLGYYWAIGIRKFMVKKYVIIGLSLAAVLHAIFNYLIIIVGNVAYTLIFLILVGFFVLNDFEKLRRRAI